MFGAVFLLGAWPLQLPMYMHDLDCQPILVSHIKAFASVCRYSEGVDLQNAMNWIRCNSSHPEGSPELEEVLLDARKAITEKLVGVSDLLCLPA